MCCAATTCEREFSVPPKKGRRFPRLSESTKKRGWQAREDHGVGAYRWRRTAVPSRFGNFGEKCIWPRPMMKRPRLQQLVASKRARVRSLRKSPQIYTVRCRSSLDHVHGGENGPGRNRQQDGKQERFDRKLTTALMRKLAGQFAEPSAYSRCLSLPSRDYTLPKIAGMEHAAALTIRGQPRYPSLT